MEKHGSVAAAWDAYAYKTSRTGGAVDWRREMAKAESIGVNIITPVDPEYPPQLLAAQGHPLVLYIKGNVKALSLPSIAMVGTRKASQYGLDQAYRFGRELAERGWTIVSGLALGIDAESHRGTLDAEGGIAVGVIGSGLNRFYPERNLKLARAIVERGGAVASEFPFDRSPDQTTFPQRNHVVAGLARATLVVEAPIKSGTMITAGISADLGRTVLAIPGRVDAPSSAGCLQLIRDGAVLVRSPGDVEAEMGTLKLQDDREKKKLGAMQSRCALSEDEKRILAATSPEGVSIDEIVRKTGLSAPQVNSFSMAMLVKGRIRFLPGNKLAPPVEM